MQDFDTNTEDSAVETEHDNDESTGGESNRDKFRGFGKNILKKFVLFVSFGPGVLGFLWLLGRILKR